jgi:hypothetical protein
MYEDEYLLIRFTSFIKRIVLKIEEKPDKNRFLFVGVSWDKTLVDKLDENGLPIGNQAITDRKKIADFLAILNKKPYNHKFLVLDIFFKDPSPDDSLLQAELYRTQNYIVSYHKDKNGKPDFPIFNCEMGLSDYETSEEGLLGISAGGFSKYSIIQGDSLKTTALLMYEKLYKKSIEKGKIFHTLDGDWIFPTFVIDHKIRSYHLFDAPDSLLYDKAYLGELLYLPEEAIWELTKDRIVVLGDFEDRDIHNTIFGEMPGPLILINSFLAIENKDNKVNMGFLFLLFVGFTLISYKAIYGIDLVIDKILPSISSSLTVRSRMQYSFFNYFFYFLVFSLFSYFIFDVHLAVLFLSIYIQILVSSIRFIKRKFFKIK